MIIFHSNVLLYIYFPQQLLNALPILPLHAHKDATSVELVEGEACIVMLHPVVADE